MKRVVIVGGGITGLSTAHALEKASEPYDVKIVEAAPRLGGIITTFSYSGFTIDGGPDSWPADKPQATRLAKEVGLGDELIGTRPDTRKVYVVRDKSLHPIPEGLELGVPSSLRPFADTALFGLDTKLRALLEPLVPKKVFAGDEDESIAAFVARRLGSEFYELVAAPLFRAMFAGDPASLSARACVPQLVEAEARSGSLLRAIRALGAAQRERRGPGSSEASAQLSLTRGVGDLVTYVAHRLRDAEISTSRAAKALSLLPPGDRRGTWAIETTTGPLFADHVALTVPANVASRLLGDLDPALSTMLGAVGYTSTASVFLAYRSYDVRHPLDAVGFVVPSGEGRPVLGCTFVSSKWDNRAPSGQALMRVLLGGAGAEHYLTRDDEGLARLARAQLRDVIGIERAPVLTKVFRFDRACPQPAVGHLGRTRRIMERVATWPGLYVGGNGFIGTDIPDSIKQGEEIAARIEGSRTAIDPAERVTAGGTTSSPRAR
jgi:protoporphyrinogen/coproporphyrinogen III oxidase